MQNKHYFIHRRGNLRHERAVLVSEQENGPGKWIDPQELGQVLSGLSHSRRNCVMSFATGLADCGHDVTLVRQWGFRTQWRRQFQSGRHPVTPVYYLLGMAYAFGLPWSLMFDIRGVDLWRRRDVLRKTADFYIENPVYMWDWDRIELQY